MKHGQTAVPALILSTMVLLIIYLLWIYPQQRYELLFGPTTEETTGTTVHIHEPVFKTTIGEIGQSSGELLDTQIISNLTVKYPETRALISSFSNLILNANALVSEHKTVDLSGIDSSKYTIEIVSSTVVGSPILILTLNDSVLYESQLMPSSRITYNLTKEKIDALGPFLRLSCQFGGFTFWTSQACGIQSFNVYRSEYYPEIVNDSDVFYLSPTSMNSELVELSFSAAKSTPYPIDLYINDRRVFHGSLGRERMTLSLDGENLGLGIDNTFKLSANPGAEYILSNINMRFSSVPSGLASKYVIFDIPENTFDYENELLVTFNLTRIIEPGDLNIKIVNTNTDYLISSDDLFPGVNRMIISMNDLEAYGNNLKIYSTSGRMVIGEFVVDEP